MHCRPWSVALRRRRPPNTQLLVAPLKPPLVRGLHGWSKRGLVHWHKLRVPPSPSGPRPPACPLVPLAAVTVRVVLALGSAASIHACPSSVGLQRSGEQGLWRRPGRPGALASEAAWRSRHPITLLGVVENRGACSRVRREGHQYLGPGGGPTVAGATVDGWPCCMHAASPPTSRRTRPPLAQGCARR
jgi:hypothetical protein